MSRNIADPERTISTTATIVGGPATGARVARPSRAAGIGRVGDARLGDSVAVSQRSPAWPSSSARAWSPRIHWPVALASLDIAIILAAVALNRALPWQLLLAYATALPLLLGVGGVYSAGTRVNMSARAPLTVGLTTVAVMGLITLNFMVLDLDVAPAGVLWLWLDTVAALLMRRALIRPSNSALFGVSAKRKTLIVGSGKAAVMVAEQLERHPEMGLETVGFVDHGPRRSVRGRPEPLLGDISLLDNIIETAGVEVVICGYTQDATEDTLIALSRVNPNVELLVVPRFFQFVSAGMKVEDLAGMPILRINRREIGRTERVLKRIEDLVLAGFGLLLVLPLAPIIALAIKLDSPGPILFTHERVGKRGKPFHMYKFRSMTERAEFDEQGLKGLAAEDPRCLKNKSDARVTRLGAFLRKWSIDEVPQLLNVLKGEMSLVGPRPPVAGEVAAYDEWQKKRLLVAPGITGLWQVSGRSDVAFDERIWLDFKYIDSWSLWLDLSILMKTVPAVLSAKGAY